MSGATAGFDAKALEQRYAFLDNCPEALLPEIVTLPLGSLPERVAGICRWRDALLAGTLPTTDVWPPASIVAPVRRALVELGLARFCKDQPELVDAVLKDVLAAVGRQTEVMRHEVVARLRELEELERIRWQAARSGKAEQKFALAAPEQHRMHAQAEREVAGRERPAEPALMTRWGERVRAWHAIADVFGDLGSMLGRGWDLALGVLRHAGWLDLVRLQAMVAELPQLREIVRALGRLHASQNEVSIADQILRPVRRVEDERHEVRSPYIPAETRGIERSGELDRMLPVEASMLGHPKLRLAWHARRAERALLTYRVEGIDIVHRWVEKEVEVEAEARRPRPERGPIVAVIDTSGSMHGLPEQVAKALVLEAVRTAHAEKRRCLLYSYSGPGQVIEHEIDLSPEGIGRLLTFLLHTFGGGTDIGAMSAVLASLEKESWKKADVIVVSDGEWSASQALVTAVHEAREAGTRFHGVQIGQRGKTGLHALCEPVHEFRDWAMAGGWP